MTNSLDSAIAELTDKLQNQMNEISETKRAINVLLRMTGKEPMFPDENPEQVRTAMNIAPDQYYGRKLATVVQEYLENRKKATGKQAIDVAEILKALETGGFDFKGQGWKDNDRLRALSISLAKNTKVFHRLPNGMFGLLAWYPEATKQRERNAEQATAEQATETEEPEGGNANAA